MCKIFHDPDIYKPYPVTIYCGNNKPRSVLRYLEKFINEINHLQRSGIIVNNRQFYVSIKAFICDRPARAFLKCIIGHGGYWACERCTVKGIRQSNRIIYPITDVESRTDISFRAQSNAEHHIGMSPLLDIEPPIDLVHQFPLDSMHLVYLGVMKKLFDYWLNSNLKNVRLSNNAKIQLSNLLIQIQRQIPFEFQQDPFQKLINLKQQNFNLYCSMLDQLFLKKYCQKIFINTSYFFMLAADYYRQKSWHYKNISMQNMY